MSRPARADKATGRLSSRHAAALSGNGIRAGARIAAGSGSRSCQQEKGLRNKSYQYAITSETSPAAASGRAPAFSFPLCGGPVLPGLREEAAGAFRPRQVLGRPPIHEPLRQQVQSLETHHPHSRSGWRNPPWAHDGTHGKTQMLLLDGASPCPRKRPVILPSQASEAVTFSRLPIGSRRPTSARTGLRDLRNVSAPRVITEDDRGGVAYARPGGVNSRQVVVPHLFE